MAHELTTPATIAATSNPIGIRADKLPYTISAAPPLTGAEVAVVEYRGGDGTFYPLLESGTQVGISADESILSIFSPMLIRVVKGATAASTAIYGSYEDVM